MPTDSSRPSDPGGDWRIEYGVLAVVVWTTAIGCPLLLFHLTGQSLTTVDHVHAVFLFVISEGIVFWLAGRPRPRRASKAPPPAVAVPTSFQAPLGMSNAGSVPGEDAEVVFAQMVEESPRGPVVPVSCEVTLTIANYLASSRPRLVQVIPAGGSYRLMPNQALQIVAVGDSTLPGLRVVESDDATQVECEDARSVTCSLVKGSLNGPQKKDLM